MPDLQNLLDQFQTKIDDLETADDWHDNNRVMEAQASIISDAEQLAKALRAVLELHKTRVHDEDPTSPFCNFCGPGTPCETTRAITDAMEDSADGQALDQARAEDDGTRITLDKYLEDDGD